MGNIKQYLITLICAAIIAGICEGVLGKKSHYRPAIRLITALFVLLTLLIPLSKGIPFDISRFYESIETDAQIQSEIGLDVASSELTKIITEQTQAYIQDKAAAMGAEIEATVELSAGNPPIPVAVKLEGSISPYAKSKLKQIIKNDIGITEENQIWS